MTTRLQPRRSDETTTPMLGHQDATNSSPRPGSADLRGVSAPNTDTRAALNRLADLYETTQALDPTPTPHTPTHQPPGPRIPPGAQTILNADEIHHALQAADQLANSLNAPQADTTPQRLRAAATTTPTLTPDQHDILKTTTTTLTRITNRDTRKIRTGMHCQTGCGGTYLSPLGDTPDRTTTDLHCDRCGHTVPHATWSRWPKARITYITIAHAAHLAGTTEPTMRKRASTHHYRRIGTGRDVRYHIDDVRADIGDTP